jgi:hypothetical protein
MIVASQEEGSVSTEIAILVTAIATAVYGLASSLAARKQGRQEGAG